MGNGISVKKLFQGLGVEIKGNKDLEVTGVCAHSKLVAPGNLLLLMVVASPSLRSAPQVSAI